MGELIVWFIVAIVAVIGIVLVFAAIGVIVWLVAMLVSFVVAAAATGAVALGAAGYFFLRYVAPVLLVIGLVFWLLSIATHRSDPRPVAAPPPVAAKPESAHARPAPDSPPRSYEEVLEDLRASAGELNEPAHEPAK